MGYSDTFLRIFKRPLYKQLSTNTSRTVQRAARYTKEFYENRPIKMRSNANNTPRETLRIKLYNMLYEDTSRRLEKTYGRVNRYTKHVTYGLPKNILKQIQDNFDINKSEILQILERNKINPEVIKVFRNARNADELTLSLRRFTDINVEETFTQKELELLSNFQLKKQKIPLETSQRLYELRRISDAYVEIVRKLTPHSDDIRVKDIERIFREKYGIKNVNLYNYDEAQKALKAIEIAKANNIPMPENYIVTPFTSGGHMGTNFNHYEFGRNSVLVCPEQIFNETFKDAQSHLTFMQRFRLRKYVSKTKSSSTSDPIHVHLHELLHCERKLCQLTDSTPLPQNLTKGIENAGEYAKNSASREEARVELKVKSLLSNLDNDEQKLLDYLS